MPPFSEGHHLHGKRKSKKSGLAFMMGECLRAMVEYFHHVVPHGCPTGT